LAHNSLGIGIAGRFCFDVYWLVVAKVRRPFVHRESARAMTRVPPTPVDIWVDGEWVRGTVRTCTVTEDGETCSAVVSYGHPQVSKTVRVDAVQMRKVSGEPGCPAVHQDATCS